MKAVALQGFSAPAYGYVNNNPVNVIDPNGLDTYMCTKPLDALGGANAAGGNRRSGPDVKGNPLYHQYICVEQGGTKTCGGQTQKDGKPFGPGAPSKDTFIPDRCEKVSDKNQCLEDCLLKAFNEPRPFYNPVNVGKGMNCQQWADSTYARCVAACQ